MSIEIKVPVLPESVADATIATWRVAKGEAVKRDQVLVDVETDKVVLEVVAPADGVIAEIIKPTGSRVKAEEVIAHFTAQAASAAEPSPPTSTQAQPSTLETPPVATSKPSSPAVRRLLAEHDLDANAVAGTGKAGRVTKRDVLTAIQDKDKQVVAPTTSTGVREERRVPMTRLRARIAQRLLQAQQEAAILTTFNEINLTKIMEVRKRYKDTFEREYGIKLGLMSFFTKAAAFALKRFPIINASVDGEDIIYHNYCDIGIAVSSPRGLVVPIIRDADQYSMADLERIIADFGQRAQAGQLSLEEMTGGTFTISNGGVFGSLLSTPILNPPQSAILGMHKIEERPIVENGAVVIRPMMYVALSYDHRIIDGAESVRFLATLKDVLEEPARFLLEI